MWPGQEPVKPCGEHQLTLGGVFPAASWHRDEDGIARVQARPFWPHSLPCGPAQPLVVLAFPRKQVALVVGPVCCFWVLDLIRVLRLVIPLLTPSRGTKHAREANHCCLLQR